MSSSDIFSEEMQSAFWSSADPEAIELLSLFESRENWTLKYDELPDFYHEMASMIPDIQELTKTGNPTPELLTRLVQILSSMSLKNNVAALVWLDSGLESEITIGWSTIVYRHSEEILISSSANENIVRCARVLVQRIQLMVRLKLLVSIFCGGGKPNA